MTYFGSKLLTYRLRQKLGHFYFKSGLVFAVNICLHFTILKLFVYVFIAPHCGQIPLCLRPAPHLPQV